MSGPVRQWVKVNSPYHGKTRSVHLELADLTHDRGDGAVFASEETIARGADCSTRTVRRALAVMLADGWIERLSGHYPGCSASYRVLHDLVQGTLDGTGQTGQREPSNRTTGAFAPSIGNGSTRGATRDEQQRPRLAVVPRADELPEPDVAANLAGIAELRRALGQ